MKHDYDLLVIGAGSGGVRAARIASLAGARVAIAEEYRIGGTCVIRGCVPKKLLVYGAEFGQHFADARGYGWSADNVRFDWPTLRDNVQREVTRLSGIYASNLAKAGVTTFQERVEVIGPNRVKLAKSHTELSATRILVATGGAPYLPEGLPGTELGITSNEAFHLPALPRRAVILGGGYIALEFANIFSGLGSDVRIVHRSDRLLRGFDDDIRAHMQIELERAGVSLSMNTTISKIEANGAGRRITLSDGEALDADVVLFAIGRVPKTAGLGLERAGVATSPDGAVIVNEFSQSSVESIYAIGDVTNRMNLTPVAIRDGHAFADTIYNDRPTPVDHRSVPSAVFGRPPIGAVGLTEADARRSHGAVDVYRTNFRPMRTTFIGGEQRTLMKLVVDAKTDQLLGVHIAGTDAPEMIQLAAVAVKSGITKTQWDSTVALHPTAAEELVLMREKVAPPGRAR
jgi:glutathione reductase (NADPH)